MFIAKFQIKCKFHSVVKTRSVGRDAFCYFWGLALQGQDITDYFFPPNHYPGSRWMVGPGLITE